MLLDRRPPEGDDCLNLNVWTPDPGAAGMPVLVWIHGGSLEVRQRRGRRLRRGDLRPRRHRHRHAQLPAAPGRLPLRRRPPGVGRVRAARPDRGARVGAGEHRRVRRRPGPRSRSPASRPAAHSVGQLLAAPAARGLFRRAIAAERRRVVRRARGGRAGDRRRGAGAPRHPRATTTTRSPASPARTLLAASRAVEARMAAVLAEHGLRPNLMSAATRVTSLSTYGGDVMP